MKLAICPGSFDPITIGHLDIISRSAKMFSKVIVVVAGNSSKHCSFTPEERVEMIKKSVADIPNVEVDHFDGLLADYAASKNAKAIIKGLRAGSYFENEFQMALINHKINPNLDTMFLASEHQYMYLSSSTVKELGNYDVDLSDFLPQEIITDFKQRIAAIHQGGNRK